VPATPAEIRACLFDLDGVLTQTDLVHTAAWQEMFDAFLRRRAARTGQLFIPFDPVSDYGRYVDGKPRADGARSFLASRGIELPEGSDDDDPAAQTVRALSDHKNEILLRRINQEGVQPYPGSVRYLRAMIAAGRSCAVVSASANCRAVLAATGLIDDFQVIVDAEVTDRERLRGKPAPDTYLAAARMLDVPPAVAAIYEDAQAGVAAGRAGGFGWVVGVDRMGQAETLRQDGADIVVQDLAELIEDERAGAG
jgi:beta-phosphoglucomutase family hydrolase